MTDVVSILIPAYNAEKWIAETINSAICQTWPKKEIIVVDDGSRDNTLAIAGQFESRFIKVLSQPNQGASAARNKALEHAQGDYVQWLDADDLLAPDKIASQMKVAATENKTTLLSSAWGCFFYRPRKANFVRTSLWQDLNPVEWVVNKLHHNYWMATQSWLVSRKLSDLAGPWDARLSADDDGEYFCRVVLSAERVKFVPDSISYVSRGNVNSQSNKIAGSEKKARSQFESMRLQIKYLRAIEDSERCRVACLAVIQRSLCLFYPEFPDLVAHANKLAGELGGQLEIPVLGWKWDWLRPLFGWKIAKQVRSALQGAPTLPLKALDYLLSQLDHSKLEQVRGKQIDAGR